MTAADKLRELLATRPAMPNTEELVRWWRASAELLPQLLEERDAWAKAGQAVIDLFDPMAHLHRAAPHTMQMVAEAVNAANLGLRDDLDDARAKLRREQDARAELRVERDRVRAELDDAAAEAKWERDRG